MSIRIYRRLSWTCAALCLAAFCWWLHDELASPTITLAARDADLREVLGSVAAQAGATLDLAPAIRGRISIEAEQSPIEPLMDDLCEAFYCDWRLTWWTAPRRLVVRPKG